MKKILLCSLMLIVVFSVTAVSQTTPDYDVRREFDQVWITKTVALPKEYLASPYRGTIPQIYVIKAEMIKATFRLTPSKKWVSDEDIIAAWQDQPNFSYRINSTWRWQNCRLKLITCYAWEGITVQNLPYQGRVYQTLHPKSGYALTTESKPVVNIFYLIGLLSLIGMIILASREADLRHKCFTTADALYWLFQVLVIICLIVLFVILFFAPHNASVSGGAINWLWCMLTFVAGRLIIYLIRKRKGMR